MTSHGTRAQKGPTDISTIQSLDTEEFAPGKFEKRWLNISVSALGPVNVPVFAYRGSAPGPTVGIIGAIHGNEVNGIPVIQQIFARLEERLRSEGAVRTIKGTLIGIPVLNVPGFLDSVRSFDGHDLNRLMPGKSNGAAPQQYAYRVFHEIVMKLDYVFDLHTASVGRQNSLYVRADMNDDNINKMATDLSPQIIVHNSSPGGSLRGCAQQNGIKALTIEIGNPSTFQHDLIMRTVDGICNTLTVRLGYPLLSDHATRVQQESPVICCRSRIVAPDEHDTVIVGLESNPVAKLGNRIVHLGVIGNGFLDGVNDGHL
ncbi:hypothetical protein N7481_004870 [Penicillium waksmanii]|uniref:uncharacterized protein n=1 Tax=Penicillium waksmanii TaxID=69791 RepID=UPI0025486AA2|nr:uncharacterized protein N7481_004870 [Penicillium waksmanii]KAJ5989660.1 hypothetical protein N7481_004870 [Penicillium waksmanii]